MAKYLLALDLGTSTTHCVLTDLQFRPLAASQAPIAYLTPDQAPSLAREIDPEALLNTLGKLVASVASRQNVLPNDIAAIGVTSQRQAVVFLDKAGKEVYCSPNLDMRAIFQGAAIDDALGQDVYHTTGHFPSFMLTSARLQWLRENQPDVLAQVSCVLPLASWLAYRLTDTIASEACIDAEAGLIDIHTRDRCAATADQWRVAPSLLPPLLPAGTSVGGLTSVVASRWGLRARIPVTIAGPDTQCALLGMGVVEEGQVGGVLGWSGALQTVTTKPCLDANMRTWAGCHLIDSLWVAEANIGDAGNAYGWLKDLLLGEDTPFEQAEALAAGVPPGSEGVLALIGPGPNTAPQAGLRIGGFLLPVPLAFQKASPGQLLRSALENVAFSVKANLATLQQIAKPRVETLHICGGMASSDTLIQTLADVTGASVVKNRYPEATARGAAMAAAVAAGIYSNLSEAVARRDGGILVYDPDPSTAAEYQGHYERWLEAAGHLAQCG